MPTLDEIRTLTIKAITQDVDKATADLNKLAQAQDGVAVVSDKTSRATKSVENSIESLRGRLDPTYKATNDFNKAQLALTLGLNTGKVSLDEYNKLAALNKQRLEEAVPQTGRFREALGGVQGQLIALSAGAGPVGVFLSALGPWGVAAAVGVGVVGEALHYLVDEANRMGDVSRQLQLSAEVSGITATQMLALQKAGAEVGLESDKVTTSIQRFTVQLDALRQGTGPLLQQIQRISPELLRQMAAAKDTATEINLLAQAYAHADEEQRNALLRAAAGRGAAGFGLLLGQINAQGGVTGLTGNKQEDLFGTEAEIKRWAELRAGIKETNETAKQLMSSIFTEEVLTREKRAADAFLSMAKSAKEIADAQAGLGFWERVINGAKNFESIVPAPKGAAAPPSDIDVARGKLAAGMGNAGTAWSSGAYGTLLAPQPGPAFNAGMLKEQISALGAAATAAEKLQLKTLELNKALADGAITQAIYNRALAGAQLQSVIEVESKRIGMLGDMATVQELVKHKQDEINLSNTQGIIITSQQKAILLDQVAVSRNASDLAIKQANDVATADALMAQKKSELNLLVAKQKLTQDEANVSLAAYARIARDTVDAEAVRKAALPSLMQLQTEGARLDKQLDTLSTGSINNMVTGLTDITMGTKTASQGFTDLGNAVLRSIEEMVIKMAIAVPLARALQSALGSFLPGGGTVNETNWTPAPRAYHSGGIVGIDGTPRYVHPAYFDFAPRLHGGLMSDEFPAILQKGETVIPKGGGMGAPSVSLSVNVTNAPSQPKVTQSSDGAGGVKLDIAFDAMVAQSIARPGSESSKFLRSGMGLSPTLIRR